MAIQDKFNKPNVIYKITKDIDLEGTTLTIPVGCTLDFQGGSFNNGTINCNGTVIVGKFDGNATIVGTYSFQDAQADEEDITQNQLSVLKFKDKAYEPDNYSGLGRIYLRKNIQTIIDPSTEAVINVNLLTQSMLAKENTIYILQYDYNLNGNTVTIPEGCILDMRGGSVTNGTINCVDTIIISIDASKLDVTLTGTYRFDSEKLVTSNTEDINISQSVDRKSHTISAMLADRDTTNGMGYVILRKDKSFKEQVTQENTIYEIRYDFDLNGEEIEIPANCALKFNGGQINNGTFIGSFDILGFANLSNISYKITGVFGEKSCTMKFSGVIDNILLPTYTECRFASQYNVPVIINKKYGTPTRYGAKGDATTDCSDAIQCLFDILSYDGGDADFSRLSNDGIALFKTTRQLVVKSTNTPSQGYKGRTAFGKIFGDAGSDYTNMEDNDYASSIIAYGLNKLESAIFFSGYANGWPVGTSISGMKIIANDDSNDDLSFAFKGISLISNLFSQCQFVGKNGVLALARDVASQGGYSLILVKWDTCKFSTTLKDRGYSYTSGYHLLKGAANNSSGDIALFENCNFEGTVECNFVEGTFLSCMWRLYNLATKLSGTVAELGLTDKSFTVFPNRATIDYGACFNVVNFHNLTIKNCYYEDHNGIINISADYPTGALNINSCYLNGITNQTFNNSLSKYVIKLKDNYQYNHIRPTISIDKCHFRIVDGDKIGFPEGVVVNNSNNNVVHISDFSCSPEARKHLIEDNVGAVVINGSKPKFRFSANPVTADYDSLKALLSDMYQKDYIPIYYPSVLDNIYVLINGITKDTSIPESEVCGFISFKVENITVYTIEFKQSDIVDGKIELSLPTQESISSTKTFRIGANQTFSLKFQALHIEEFIGANMNVVTGIE